jgi:SulP family sulfate permease
MAVAVMICGAVQLLATVLRLGRFVSLVPEAVMLGFANGLAIIIARAQLGQFRDPTPDGTYVYVQGPVLWGMIATTAVSMAAAILFPKIPRVGQLVPGPLVAVIAATIFSCATNSVLPQRTLEHVAGSETFRGGLMALPPWNFPPADVQWHDESMWMKVVMTGVRMGFVGLVESMLTLRLIDRITETLGSTTQECFAQGLGNLVCSFFGLQGGCALIGQSLINIGSGGRGRLVGFIMSTGMGASVVFVAPIVGKIPVAAFVGIMFIVSLNTFAWGSVGLLRRIDMMDALVIVVVTVVTVLTDLATAVLCGIFLSALTFAWNAARFAEVEEFGDGKTIRNFKLRGVLFFGSTDNFMSKIQAGRIPEPAVHIDLSAGKILDHSALDAVVKTVEKLVENGKSVTCQGLSDDARAFLSNMTTENVQLQRQSTPELPKKEPAEADARAT